MEWKEDSTRAGDATAAAVSAKTEKDLTNGFLPREKGCFKTMAEVDDRPPAVGRGDMAELNPDKVLKGRRVFFLRELCSI